jgi:hypothetical protein
LRDDLDRLKRERDGKYSAIHNLITGLKKLAIDIDNLSNSDSLYLTQTITQKIINFINMCNEFKTNKSNININFEINEVLDYLNRLK